MSFFTSPCKLAISVVVFTLFTHLASAADASRPAFGNIFRPPGVPRIGVEGLDAPKRADGTELPPYNTVYYFDQLIDHTRPALGTFKQRYWHTWEYYQTGGPIILMTPGEFNAKGYEGYLTNSTICGLIAQQQKGATIMLEHRFFGLSNPLPDLSVKSLQLHTIQQAIDDLEYFAKNVKLQMPGGDKVGPGKAPWILVGGSYGGALVSWTMANKPNIFFAGYASSGVVQALTNFWAYFDPIRENMPQNCSADVQAVIAYVDQAFSSGNLATINGVKNNFGLGSMAHLDDAAAALRLNLWDWQLLDVTSGPDTKFRKFCDALEVKNGVSAPPGGWGLSNAYFAWGRFWTTYYLPQLCGRYNAEDCLGTYNTNSPYWSDTRIDNSDRSWFWIVCNEVGWFQVGAPTYRPTLVSRLVQPSYELRRCQQMFPAAFPQTPRDVNVTATNVAYSGWNVRNNRLYFANGNRDPWRDVTMSAAGLGARSTNMQPIALSNGFHCSDMNTAARIEPSIDAVQKNALAYMKAWLPTWRPTPSPRDSESEVSSERRFNEESDGLEPPMPAVPEPPRFVPETKPIRARSKSFGAFSGALDV